MFSCEICNRKFNTASEYAGHKSQCGMKEDFCCEICNKKFYTTKGSFKQHIKSHENDKVCPVCNKRFHGRKINTCCSIECGAKYRTKRDTSQDLEFCINCEKSINNINHSGKKYCSIKCQQEHQWKLKKIEIEEKGEFEENKNKQIRKYLFEKHGNVCSICGGTHWQGQLVPLVADHIDGNALNNKIENLRLICNNCDAQLPTYKSRNRGNGRFSRRKRYKEGKSF